MKNFDSIIAALQSTSAERLLQNSITEAEWASADKNYGVFYNVETGKIEIWPSIQERGWAEVAERQNPVQFLGFIDVDTAITVEWERIIDELKYKQEQA